GRRGDGFQGRDVVASNPPVGLFNQRVDTPPYPVVRPPSRRPVGGPPPMRLSITFMTWRGAMNRLLKLGGLSFALALSALLLAAPPTGAQTVTTGAISGTVADESGGVLPGATIEAVHEPTGTRYTAVSGTGGAYSILNVRVGGPYTVSVKLSGFK